MTEIKEKIAMITEDYVSFMTANLLKEKGFNEYCHSIYNEVGDAFFDDIDCMWRNSDFREDVRCTRPTLQSAMKWLREEHKLHIVIWQSNESGHPYRFKIQYIGSSWEYTALDFVSGTYEGMADFVIIYCLKEIIGTIKERIQKHNEYLSSIARKIMGEDNKKNRLKNKR